MDILKVFPNGSKMRQNVVLGGWFVALGRVFRLKRVPWRCLGGVLGPLGGLLEISLGCLGHLEGRLGDLWGPLGVLLEVSWGSFGSLGKCFGQILKEKCLPRASFH